MNILILNWRDLKNPDAGGAEQLTHEMAKRWVIMGNKVLQISAGFRTGKGSEVVDGVKIIRMGRWWSVHFFAGIYYLLNLRKFADVVIDEVHWFPFFARLYARRKTVLLVCEVADSLFDVLFLPIVAWTGKFLERSYLSLYRNGPTLAISPSTKADLVKRGFMEEGVTVLPMGLSYPAKLKYFFQAQKPTLLYLGRLSVQKGVNDAIEVFELLSKKVDELQMWVVGSGEKDYVKRLKQKVEDKGLSKSIIFYGYVSVDKKYELLSRAHVLIVPSQREGWGLIVPEAGMVETPAVVYDVAGLKDVVNNGQSGYVVSRNPQDMADKVLAILINLEMQKKMGREARRMSLKYNWDNTAKVAMEFMKQI